MTQSVKRYAGAKYDEWVDRCNMTEDKNNLTLVLSITIPAAFLIGVVTGHCVKKLRYRENARVNNHEVQIPNEGNPG